MEQQKGCCSSHFHTMMLCALGAIVVVAVYMAA